ncbi:hypothetical protein M0Q39_06520 [Patescibacteria group bacterium]|nr:hypothetical protein [Patescibacteria group bacterium]
MINIPKGKEVKIMRGSQNLMEPHEKIILSSPITASFTSTFDSLLPDMSGAAMNFLNLITTGVNAVTGKGIGARFKEQGFQVWQTTQPIKFSFECMFSFKTSGERDVLIPAKKLIKLPLPEEKGWGLTPPGPTILQVFEGKNPDANTLPYANNFSFRCGVFYLPKILISSVEPTWSEEYDSRGYPMHCTLRVDVESIYTATTNQIDKFGI